MAMNGHLQAEELYTGNSRLSEDGLTDLRIKRGSPPPPRRPQ
jgi:hypothetical protein